ncbi:hypothetical protein GLOTRDRAFT_116073 [Gloeophyllum trabeum ATCC 11539]|uniref:Uncharacterized protein n=1 Tax=Gloeophyllum trabeum (strain ATCC 11539 / FP-39264 / Madison 617) TaxID=670483 RepID=S7Q925_GLOTA|nr:uncharacterized protein GLOTRDRAFT_116073 [Gloeophyllum trabeum ATCC 11539]EPQ55948.1 hypothetical protein GLOTRDRAFT_116073 [Gloeophyllum trabeum ATCC 11539]
MQRICYTRGKLDIAAAVWDGSEHRVWRRAHAAGQNHARSNASSPCACGFARRFRQDTPDYCFIARPSVPSSVHGCSRWSPYEHVPSRAGESPHFLCLSTGQIPLTNIAYLLLQSFLDPVLRLSRFRGIC